MKKFLIVLLFSITALAQNGRQTDQMIRAVDYGVIPDGRYILDVTATNSSQTVTCPNSDCAFTSADVGKVVFGIYNSNGYQGGGAMGSGLLVVPQGTISAVTNANSITVSNAATASHTGNTMLVYGTDNTAALAAAFKAAQPTIGPCYAIELPAGLMLDQNGQFNNAPANCIGSTGLTRAGVTVIGHGAGISQIVLTPNFVWSTCNGPNSGCFGDNHSASYGFSGGTYFKEWSVSGMGYSGGGPSVYGPTYIAVPNDNSIFSSWYALGIGSANANLNCMNDIGNPSYLMDVQLDGCGGGIVLTASGYIYASGQTYAGDSSGIDLEVTGGYFQSIGDNWGPPAAGVDGVYVTGGVFNSINDYIAYTSSGSGGNLVHVSAGTVYFTNDDLIDTRTGTATNIYITGGKLYLEGTSITQNNGTYGIANSGGSIFDLGGNTISASIPYNNGGGHLYGTASITGTTQTSGNWSVPAGSSAGQWGTSPSVGTCSGDSRLQQCTITVGSGTVGSNPVVTITFPTPFLIAPSCQAQQVGGTQTIENYTTGTVTTTSEAFTAVGTPTASATIVLQVRCGQ